MPRPQLLANDQESVAVEPPIWAFPQSFLGTPHYSGATGMGLLSTRAQQTILADRFTRDPAIVGPDAPQYAGRVLESGMPVRHNSAQQTSVASMCIRLILLARVEHRECPDTYNDVARIYAQQRTQGSSPYQIGAATSWSLSLLWTARSTSNSWDICSQTHNTDTFC